VEGDSRQATLGCSAPSSVLPFPMALLGRPGSVPPDRPDLVDPLHLANPLDLVLDSDYAIPLHDQSHHCEDGEVEEGGCHPLADRPWPTEKLGVMVLKEGDELERQRRSMNSRGRGVEEKPIDLTYGCRGVRRNEGHGNRSDAQHRSDALHRSNCYRI
jgi:hypothetical protein